MAFPLAGVWRWLTKPTFVEPAADAIVELTRFTTVIDAESLSQLLRGEGIAAQVFGAESTRYTVDSGGFDGVRVMVRGDELVAAREIMADFYEDLRQRNDPSSD